MAASSTDVLEDKKQLVFNENIERDMIEYITNLYDKEKGVLKILNQICSLDANGGFLSNNSVKKIMKIMLYPSNSIKCITYLQKLLPFLTASLIEIERYSAPFVFGTNMRHTLNEEEEWYFDRMFSSVEPKLDNYYLDFIMLIVQTINRLMINKKVNSNIVNERFMIRTIFSCIKNILFFNTNTSFTQTMLYEKKPTISEKEAIFIGRNSFLRSAWSLFISLIYIFRKRKEYPDSYVQIDENELLKMYANIMDYWHSKEEELNKLEDDIEKPKEIIYRKIILEYQNKCGIISFALICFHIYKYFLQYMDFNNNHTKYLFNAWLWPNFREELQSPVFTYDHFSKINVFDKTILFEDSKHLHSFRATRTFGTSLPLRYWNYRDPQDSAAVFHSKTILGKIIVDVSTAFGKYDSYLRDFTKSEQIVTDLRNILYIKMLDLKNILHQEISKFIEIESNGDVPTIVERINAQSFDEIKESESPNNDVKWVKFEEKGEIIFLKMNENVFSEEKKIEQNTMTFSRFDENVKMQKQKMIRLDILQSEILEGQSILRYLESVFQKFFPEARRF